MQTINKHSRRRRRYPRMLKDELVDGHELLNDSLRATIENQRVEIAELKFELLKLRSTLGGQNG